MHKIALIIILISTGCYSQFYTGVAIDPNKAFGIIDNPRTEMDHRGLHFDLETGFIKNEFGFYLLYGSFKEANYQKLAAGADYFFFKNEKIEIGIGSSISNIWKKDNATQDKDTYFGWLGRCTGILWVHPKFGLNGHFQYQSRPDLEVTGIFEGKIGLRYIFRR